MLLNVHDSCVNYTQLFTSTEETCVAFSPACETLQEEHGLSRSFTVGLQYGL